MKYEVEKYIRIVNWNGKNKYQLKVGGLFLYFSKIIEAQKYYEKYIK